jgi:hypothetical protein
MGAEAEAFTSTDVYCANPYSVVQTARGARATRRQMHESGVGVSETGPQEGRSAGGAQPPATSPELNPELGRGRTRRLHED